MRVSGPTLACSESVAIISCHFSLKDTAKRVQFTILNDRSQGGSSLNDGQLELMVCMDGCLVS